MRQEQHGPLACGEICKTASLVDDLFPHILFCTAIPLMKSEACTASVQDEEGMCHHMVMPTLLLTDTMNLQADSAVFILNSVMDWDFDHCSD